MSKILDFAKETFQIEADSLRGLIDLLDQQFEDAVNTILECDGKLIVTGMGKSGIVGKKIAATLASTGTPSFFLHPGEAYHGDLGMISSNDIVLMISNSGETDEVLKIIPFLVDNENIMIGMSGNPSSTLGRNAHFHLNIAVQKEACPLSLAPTSSTTATMAMGDALAVALMNMRDFKSENFARFHPGGSLGRRLVTKVEMVMRKENLPVLDPSDSIQTVIHTVNAGRLGLSAVKENGLLTGIITDGDIRRAMELKQEEFFSLKAKDIMSSHPKTIKASAKLREADQLMTQYKINSLLVVDEQEALAGVVQIYDLGI